MTDDAFERITGQILADPREAEHSWIASICSFESSTGSRSKIHLIPPMQGGVVVEPVERKEWRSCGSARRSPTQ